MEKKHKFHPVFYWKLLAADLILLFLVVIFMESINFISVKSSTRNSLNRLFYSEGAKQVDVLESQMEAVRKVTADVKLRSAFYKSFQEQNRTGSLLDIQNYLSTFAPWLSFFTNLYYYDITTGTVVTSVGLMENSIFLQKGLSISEPLTAERLKEQEFLFLPGRDKQSEQDVLIIVALLEEKQGTPLSCLLFTVNKQQLDNLFSIPDEYQNGHAELRYKDTSVYSFGRTEKSQTGKETKLCVSGTLFTLIWRIPESAYTQAIWDSVWKQFLLVFTALAVGSFIIYKVVGYHYKPLKNLLDSLVGKLPPKETESLPSDEFVYLDMMLGNLLYSQQFLEESNQELKREQLLYQLFCYHIQKSSVIYEECLRNGIRVDRNSFICLYLEESGEDDEWYTYLTEDLIHQTEDTDVYSTYYTESGFLFFIASGMNADKLENFLKQKITPTGPVQVVFGQAVSSTEQIHDSYRSLQTDQTNKPTVQADASSDYGAMYPKTSLAALLEASQGERFEKMSLALQDICETVENAPVSTAITTYLEAANILSEDQNDDESILKLLEAGKPAGECMSRHLAGLYKQFRAKSVLQISETPKTEATERWGRSMESILRYIDENCADNSFSIKVMAMDMGTTPSNLSHYFKKYTGQNISKYIDTVKMKRAVELLKRSDRIADIAVQLGYNSTSVFTETFKRVHGLTPNQYRQNQIPTI